MSDQYDGPAMAQKIIRLQEEVTKLRADAEWQPIETAPKDVLIDIWIQNKDGGGVRWCDCHYDQICHQWRTSRPSGHLVTVSERYVTHWMSSPKPPIDAARGAT